MKYFFLFIAIVIAFSLNAQSIKTKIEENINLKECVGLRDVSFSAGDTITIHAYKKKNNLYYFIVETRYYANLVVSSVIPFNVEQKELKRLPNALSDNAKIQLDNHIKDVENRIRFDLKNSALSGLLKENFGGNVRFTGVGDAIGGIRENDSVYILGYKNEGNSTYKWALYTNKAAGIFLTNKDIGNINGFSCSYLPSIDDTDVLKVLQEKRNILLQIENYKKIKYRNKALKGEVFGVIESTYLKDDDDDFPYSLGDTVSLIGYSKKGAVHYYAMYSNKGAGIFHGYNSVVVTFKNSGTIQYLNLASVDDPEVKSIIESKKTEIDSLNIVQTARILTELEESKQNLINTLKMCSPVVVRCDSWSSNSAGGIEVSVTVTNCSSQTIKYITLQGYFENAVGDKCRNEIGGGTIWKARGIGPIGPVPTSTENFDERWDDCRASYTFDNLTFYSRVADTFHFSSIAIQYMNGKTITLSGKNLKSHVIYD